MLIVTNVMLADHEHMTRRQSKQAFDHGPVIRPLDGEEYDVKQEKGGTVPVDMVRSIRPGVLEVLQSKRQRKPAEPVRGLNTPFGSVEDKDEVRLRAARKDEDDGMGSVMGGGF